MAELKACEQVHMYYSGGLGVSTKKRPLIRGALLFIDPREIIGLVLLGDSFGFGYLTSLNP